MERGLCKKTLGGGRINENGRKQLVAENRNGGVMKCFALSAEDLFV